MRLLFCAIFLILLAGCGRAAPEDRAPSANALPAIARLDGVARSVSAHTYLDGADLIESRGTVNPSGTTVELFAAEGYLSWALYRTELASELWGVSLDWGASPGTTAWIAVADFSAGSWLMQSITSPEVALPPFSGDLTRFKSPSGFAYVALLASTADYVVSHINLEMPGPTLNWTRSLGTDAGTEYWQIVDVDDLGNVFCAGSYYASGSPEPDMLVANYDPYGNLRWAKIIVAPVLTEPTGGIVDDAGGFVVAAAYQTDQADGKNPMLLYKLDSFGALEWSYLYNTGGVDTPNGLSPDGSGGLLLSGEVIGGGALLARLDGDGNPVWGRTWAEGGNEEGIDADASGSQVYATARWGNGVCLARFTLDGMAVWQKRWTLPAFTIWPEVVADDNFGVYFGSGLRDIPGGVLNYDILHFDSTGSVINQFAYQTTSQHSYLVGLQRDESDNLLIGVHSGLELSEIGLVRLTTDGTLLSALRLVGKATADPSPYELGVRNPVAFRDGRFYLAGGVEQVEPAMLVARVGSIQLANDSPGTGSFTIQQASLTRSTASLNITNFISEAGPNAVIDSYLVAGEY